MFHFIPALILCLGLAIPSHAFFGELLQAAETIFEKQDPKQTAKDLDEKLENFKKRLAIRFEKIAQSDWLPSKLRKSLLESLTILENEIIQKVEALKKALNTPETSAPKTSDL